jgi:tetratricopeptide (TPR) repeat protein
MDRRLVMVLLSFLVLSCSSPEEKDYDVAMKEVNQGHYRTSLTYFDRVLKRSPESDLALAAAREGARVCIFDLKDFKKATTYFRHLILHSTDSKEIESVQKQLAEVYFENMADYGQAVIEYNKLLGMNLPFSERAQYKISLARSYFYLGQFSQAESEIDDLLKERLQDSMKFNALNMKGNVLVARKQFAPAAEVYKAILKDFPERSQQEHIGLQLAVCYEESQDFAAAIRTLEAMKSTYKPAEYIELRIKRLQERMRNQPGARGRYRK